MSEPRAPRDLLLVAARALAPVRDEFVVVGGCAPVMYELGPLVTELRPTLDLDCVVQASSYGEYAALVERWRRDVGLRPVSRRGAPICRHEVGGVEIDLLPTHSAALGFSNRWYPAAVHEARVVELEPEVLLRVVTPLYFVATKLEALKARGRGDLRLDEDFEDIVTVLAGLDDLIAEIAEGSADVHDFVRTSLASRLARPDAREIVAAHFEPDAATQARVPLFLARLRDACA